MKAREFSLKSAFPEMNTLFWGRRGFLPAVAGLVLDGLALLLLVLALLLLLLDKS